MYFVAGFIAGVFAYDTYDLKPYVMEVKKALKTMEKKEEVVEEEPPKSGGYFSSIFWSNTSDKKSN